MKITIPANNWQPRFYQKNLWNAFEAGYKRLLEIAHRRWGKDEIALNIAAVSIFEHPATYWHMLPEYSQARKAIWNAINPHTNKRRIDEAFPLEIRETTNEHEMFIRFINGATWQVVGSDSYKSLVGAPPYGIVFSEWSKAHPAAWAYLSPILEENGGWAAFITTPEGKNHAHAMYNMAKRNPERWFAEIQTVDDTGFSIDKVEAAREEYRALYGIDAGDALIEQEYYCSFEAAILGAVYGKQMARITKDGRITDKVKHDPNYPVYTAFDLGRSDATVIWFYQIGHNEILLIDYFEENFLDVQDICEALYGREIIVGSVNPVTKEVESWEWGEWNEHKHRDEYNYHDFHYVPQDAGHKLQSAGGRSIVEQAREFGIKMSVMPETTHANRHAALRKTLDRCWFGSRCDKGVEALRCYHFEWNEDKRDFSKEPYHDWSSHGATAAELMARVWSEKVVTQKEVENKRIETKFHRLRSEHGLTKEDPYRTRKR